MNLNQRVDVTLKQQLHLTPELKQGIAVLQMSAIDLCDYVKTCIEENPFLDDDWIEPRHPKTERQFSQQVSSDALFEKRGHGSPERFDQERASQAQRKFSFDRFLTEGETLEQTLTKQLHLQTDDERDRLVGDYIIGNIDDNGYLIMSVEDLAATLCVDKKVVERVLALIQQFEPLGVGARSLAECLLIQLKAKGSLNPLVEDVIKNYLPDFATKSIASVARDIGVSVDNLQAVLETIRTCTPHPAAQYGRTESPIWPEIVVCPLDTGGYEVQLQDLYLPHLKINSYYRTLAETMTDCETKKYLKEKMKEAEGLIGNINYRRTTLYKVACYIVEMQVDFLNEGYSSIRPLTMAQVAEAIDVSESTVSRVAKGNFMQTPRGIFELRFFFHSAAGSTDNYEVSSVSVKHRIKEIVANEDAAHPLSDRAITDMLLTEGVVISRRTVNKYREELGIPVCSVRKKR